VLIFAAANFYQQLREIGGVGLLQDVTIRNAAKVLQLYRESDKDELDIANTFNIELRALSTVAAVAKYEKVLREKDIRLGNGLEIWNSLLRATPSGYFVDKSSTFVMEGLATQLTDGAISGERDIGDSLILEGMIDFGHAGVLIYPLVIFLLICLSYYFFLLVNNGLVIVMVVVTTVFATMTMFEGSIGFLFLSLRSCLFFLALLLAVKWLFSYVKTMEALKAT
jgi:hypothetical protein